LGESCLVNTFEQANDTFFLGQVWVYLSLFNYLNIDCLLGIFNLGSLNFVPFRFECLWLWFSICFLGLLLLFQLFFRIFSRQLSLLGCKLSALQKHLSFCKLFLSLFSSRFFSHRFEMLLCLLGCFLAELFDLNLLLSSPLLCVLPLPLG